MAEVWSAVCGCSDSREDRWKKAIENGGARSCTPTVMVALGFTSSFLFFFFFIDGIGRVNGLSRKHF